MAYATCEAARSLNYAAVRSRCTGWRPAPARGGVRALTGPMETLVAEACMEVMGELAMVAGSPAIRQLASGTTTPIAAGKPRGPARTWCPVSASISRKADAMDLRYTPEQQQLDGALGTALTRLAGAERAREMGPKMDLGVLGAFDAAGFLDVGRDGGPVEAVLVVQRAAEALACAPIAARALVAPLAGIDGLPPAIGLVHGRAGSLVRYAGECEAFVVLDGSRALVAGTDDVEIEPVEPAFGASSAGSR